MLYDVTEFYGGQSARAGFTSDDGNHRADATDTLHRRYSFPPFFIFFVSGGIMMETR